MDKIALMFDDLGDMYEVDNPQEMLSVTEDTELISIYKATNYEHRLILAMEELVQLGYIKGMGNKTYNVEAGEYGIECLTEEVVNRFGLDAQKKILSEIDLSWEANKPKLPNKRKDK